MHLSKSWAFSWFGCTHTKWGHNEKQDAFHRTLGCLMVWLHSYELRSWQTTKCISPNPRNSYGLVAVTPVDVTTKANCISTNARIFCGVAAIMPNKATKRKQDACHHILGILLIWLHWRQIRPQWKTRCILQNPRRTRPQWEMRCISPNPRNSLGSAVHTKSNHNNTNGCVSPSPRNSHVLAAFTINESETNKNMPWWSHSQKLDAMLLDFITWKRGTGS